MNVCVSSAFIFLLYFYGYYFFIMILYNQDVFRMQFKTKSRPRRAEFFDVINVPHCEIKLTLYAEEYSAAVNRNEDL